MALSDGMKIKQYGWNWELDKVIPDNSRKWVADSSILLKCINHGDFEEATDYLFSTRSFVILMWNAGDYEKVSRVCWLENCRLTKFTFKDKDKKERVFSIIHHDDVMSGICGIDNNEILRTILHIIKHNIDRQEILNNENKLEVLKLLFEVVKDSGELDYDTYITSYVYPMGKNDYIYFEKDNYIQTTLFDKSVDMEYEGICIIGASRNFAVQGDNYYDECADEVSIVYPWEEERHTLDYIPLMNDRRTRKLLEDTFGIDRCCVWDNVM